MKYDQRPYNLKIYLPYNHIIQKQEKGTKENNAMYPYLLYLLKYEGDKNNFAPSIYSYSYWRLNQISDSKRGCFDFGPDFMNYYPLIT